MDAIKEWVLVSLGIALGFAVPILVTAWLAVLPSIGLLWLFGWLK